MRIVAVFTLAAALCAQPSYLLVLAFTTLVTHIALWAAGIVVSVGVGLFFGIRPASKSARLDAVEALRYE